MEPIHLFPQWNNQNKDYFIDTNKVAPFTITPNNHPFYKEKFFSSYIKPGIVPNLFVLCRPNDHYWGAWDRIRPELKIESLILEIVENGNKYIGKVTILDHLDKVTYCELCSQGDRKWRINGDIRHPNGFRLSLLSDVPKPSLHESMINDIPLDIRFNSRNWTLEFYPTIMNDLNAKIIGVAFVIEMDVGTE